LMVFGFFFASIAVRTVGSLLLYLYGTVMANVQGNSITGLASIVALVGVFMYLIIHLVHEAFNFGVLTMPDQVMNWVGGHAASSFGRNTEGKSSTFISTGAGGVGRGTQALLKPSGGNGGGT